MCTMSAIIAVNGIHYLSMLFPCVVHVHIHMYIGVDIHITVHVILCYVVTLYAH